MPGLGPSTYVDPAQPVSRLGDPGTAVDSDILAMRCKKKLPIHGKTFRAIFPVPVRRMGFVPARG